MQSRPTIDAMDAHVDNVAALQAEAEEWVAVPSEVDSRTRLPLLAHVQCVGLPHATTLNYSITVPQ